MPVYLYPVVVPVALALVGLLGWLAWLRFNWRVYDASKDLAVFDHTAQLGPAFLHWLRSPAKSAGDRRETRTESCSLEDSGPLTCRCSERNSDSHGADPPPPSAGLEQQRKAR